MSDDRDEDEGLNAARADWRRQELNRIFWGEQGPIQTVLTPEGRIIAVYNKLLKLTPNATYHDFLGAYIKLALGVEWWNEQAMKLGDPHELIRWQRKVTQFQLRHWRGIGVQKATNEGVVSHYYHLAFDLHTIEHQGLLQQSLVKRLKNPEQFQGARYEVAVAAAFVRGGFKVALEPEGKGPEKRCEFVATHVTTDVAYSVEVKSRHLDGVLGRAGTFAELPAGEPKIRTLILKALQKKAAHQRVICIDVNVPQPEGLEASDTWGPIVRRQVNEMEAKACGPAILLLTNSPLHYLADRDPSRGQIAMLMGLNQRDFHPNDQQSVDRTFPGLTRVMRALTTRVPPDWP